MPRQAPCVRPVQRPEASGSPPLRSSPQILDSRASRSRAFLCGRRGKAGAIKSARIRRTRRDQRPLGGNSLLDHLVGAGKQLWRHSEAERLGCPEIDDELELDWRPMDMVRSIGSPVESAKYQ